MRGFASSVRYAVRTEKPLAILGGAKRTFGSLAAFVTLALLCLGVFLIQNLFANPLASQSVALFAAAFILAIALLLLYELLQLPRPPWQGAAQGRAPLASRKPQVHFARRTASRSDFRTDLPYQRCYVDRVRVRA